MGFLTNFTVFFILWTCLKYLAAQCPDGWFGSKCQYMCHCERNTMCDTDGRCPAKCNTGWFGPGCQYEDLASVAGAQVSTPAVSSSTSWLTDQDVRTCNEDVSLDSITVQWDRPYPFTWLRLQATNASDLQLNFVFTSSNISYSCLNQLVAIVDALTVDYRCEINDTMTSLRVTGPGLNRLCSLYVSGDRNVALKQSTDQTGTFEMSSIFYNSSLAVDGDTNPYFLQNKCSHTTNDSTLSVYPASWTLTLDTARVVSRITIYNRDCELGTWGLECARPCPAECRYSCKQDTGTCYQCLGYLDPPHCSKACLPKTWGINCQNNCSASCYDKSCDGATGLCNKGCIGYSDPPACTTECASGKWGHNCSYDCNNLCLQQTCDRVTGLCHQQVPTTASTLECASGKWGHNCSYECNNLCLQETCDRVTGLCHQQVPTTSLTVVSESCSSLGLGAGIGIGIAVGVISVILVEIALYFVFIKRRRPAEAINDPLDMKQGRQIQQYDTMKEKPPDKPHYESVDSNDLDKTLETKASSSINSSPYENETTQYETYSLKNVYR